MKKSLMPSAWRSRSSPPGPGRPDPEAAAEAEAAATREGGDPRISRGGADTTAPDADRRATPAGPGEAARREVGGVRAAEMGRPCYSSTTPLRCSGSRWRLPPRRPSKIGTTAGAAADAEVDEAVEEAADAVVDEEVDAAPARPTTGPHLLAAHPKVRHLCLFRETMSSPRCNIMTIAIASFLLALSFIASHTLFLPCPSHIFPINPSVAAAGPGRGRRAPPGGPKKGYQKPRNPDGPRNTRVNLRIGTGKKGRQARLAGKRGSLRRKNRTAEKEAKAEAAMERRTVNIPE